MCERCGGVTDVVAELPEVRLPPGMEQGFSISDTQIVFRGRCASCATARADEIPPTDEEALSHHG